MRFDFVWELLLYLLLTLPALSLVLLFFGLSNKRMNIILIHFFSLSIVTSASWFLFRSFKLFVWADGLPVYLVEQWLPIACALLLLWLLHCWPVECRGVPAARVSTAQLLVMARATSGSTVRPSPATSTAGALRLHTWRHAWHLLERQRTCVLSAAPDAQRGEKTPVQPPPHLPSAHHEIVRGSSPPQPWSAIHAEGHANRRMPHIRFRIRWFKALFCSSWENVFSFSHSTLCLVNNINVAKCTTYCLLNLMLLTRIFRFAH